MVEDKSNKWMKALSERNRESIYKTAMEISDNIKKENEKRRKENDKKH